MFIQKTQKSIWDVRRKGVLIYMLCCRKRLATKSQVRCNLPCSAKLLVAEIKAAEGTRLPQTLELTDPSPGFTGEETQSGVGRRVGQGSRFGRRPQASQVGPCSFPTPPSCHPLQDVFIKFFTEAVNIRVQLSRRDLPGR